MKKEGSSSGDEVIDRERSKFPLLSSDFFFLFFQKKILAAVKIKQISVLFNIKAPQNCKATA